MSLIKRAFISLKWTSISSIIVFVIQFGVLIILARLLRPEDFGLFAIVTIISGFVQVFSDAGISAAIIHHQSISKETLSSLYWINILSGIIATLLIVGVTPLVSIFFEEQRLTGLIFVSSINFVFISFGQQFRILLEKDLNFNPLAIIDIISILLAAIVSIVLGFMGAGAYSLVFGQLVNSLSKSTQLLIYGIKHYRPMLHFSKKDLKGFVGFGLYQMGEKSINYFAKRVDQFIIGKVLGTTELGYYNLAFNLVTQPLTRINHIINRVAFPVFSIVQNKHELIKQGYFKTIKYLSFINFPILIGLVVLAQPFVLYFYGEAWEPSINIIEILAFVALIRAWSNPIGSLMLAKGRPDLGFKWNIILFLVNSIVLYYASSFGLKYVAYALLILQTLYLLFSYPFFMRPLLGSCKMEFFFDSFFIPLFYALFMGAFIHTIIYLKFLPQYYELAVGIFFGIIIYGILLYLLEKDEIITLKNLLVSKN